MDKGEHYIVDMVNSTVIDQNSNYIGIVKEILSLPAHDLVVVDIKAGQVNMDDWNMYRGNLFRNGLYRAQSNMANISVNTNMGWNLIGIPVMVSDSYYLNIFK